MRGSPGFSGELGNYCDTSPCCMIIHYWFTRVVTSICSSFNKVVLCALGKVGMALKDKQLMAIQQVYTARTSLVPRRVCMATNRYGKYTCMSSYRLYSCLVSTLERQKLYIIIVEVQVSAWCSCTLQLYVLLNISPCYYLQVHVMCLDELYRKCSRTAHARANSGYQALLSDFCWAPGNEAT